MTTADDLADAAQVAELHRQNEEWATQHPAQYASTGTTKDPATWWHPRLPGRPESVPKGPESRPSQDTAGALKTSQRSTGGVSAGEMTRSVDAALHQSPTTTPEFGDGRPRGDVPGLRPNPGMLRALLQPVLFLKLEEAVGAFEVGDVLAAQFWGEGRVMLTPLPAAAAKGRIPTTFPANKIHAVIAGPVAPHYDGPAEGTDAYDALHPLG